MNTNEVRTEDNLWNIFSFLKSEFWLRRYCVDCGAECGRDDEGRHGMSCVHIKTFKLTEPVTLVITNIKQFNKRWDELLNVRKQTNLLFMIFLFDHSAVDIHYLVIILWPYALQQSIFPSIPTPVPTIGRRPTFCSTQLNTICV